MKAVDSVLAWLFPAALVEGTPWAIMWASKERQSFLAISILLFPLVAIVYIAHIFFYDIPNDLQPIEGWVAFRIGFASLALATWIFYLSPLAKTSFYRVPAIIVYWLISESQAVVALVYGLESWVFCFVLVFASILALRMSALNSLLFALFTIATQSFVLIDANISPTYIFTGSIVTCVMILIVRAPYKSEVQNFLLDQRNIEAQREIIELNIEFSSRIRAFIPKVIANRIDDCIDKRGMSVVEASIEVMQPKQMHVACLFSDIRGFTEGSKDLNAFVQRGVLPEVRAATEAIELCFGIPRKIGDLIFAYFDEESHRDNLINSARAAFELSRINQVMNTSNQTTEIKRYVLLSYGEAVVGNLGGASSSVEITALGTPVNLLSRVDESTKALEKIYGLKSGDIIVTADYCQALIQYVPALLVEDIDLVSSGIAIRNFEDVTSLHKVVVSERNFEVLENAHQSDISTVATGGSSPMYQAS